MTVRLSEIAGYRFLTYPRDMYVSKSLEFYGEFSYGEIELIRQLVRPSDCVVEVGANIGAHTVFLAREVCPQGQVWAFEPRRQLFQMLCANLALNDVQNVKAFQEGVGDVACEVEEGPIPQGDAQANLGGLTIGALKGGGEWLSIAPLDARLKRLPKVRLLKADVEGWEQQVLRGANALIARDRPILYVENHYDEQSADLIRHIRGLGYRLWWHLPHMYREDNRAGNPYNLFGRTISLNMLGLPEESPIVVKHLRPVAGDDDRPRLSNRRQPSDDR